MQSGAAFPLRCADVLESHKSAFDEAGISEGDLPIESFDAKGISSHHERMNRITIPVIKAIDA
jgi:hypothetical protein